MKKFYDIIPPKNKKDNKLASIKAPISGIKKPTKQIIENVKNVRNTEILGKVISSPKRVGMIFEKKKKKKSGIGLKLGKIFAFFAIFLILVMIPGIILFSETEIEIWPETRILKIKETITIDLNQKEIDLENKIIPSEIFKDQKFGSHEFSSTGSVKKEEKAKGIIHVYNNYSTSDQPLLINTRFVSEDGKLFRSLKREIIKGGRYEKGKLVAGETDIEVRAAEPGEDYNIPPSTFSIPGFSGTPKYTAFYGKSFSPMIGGTVAEVLQVTQGDLDKAKNDLSARLKKESREFLKTALPDDYILAEESIIQEITEESFSNQIDDAADSFTADIRILSSAFMFKKSDIENLSKRIISSDIIENEEMQENSLEIDYIFKDINIEEGKMDVEIIIKAKIYKKIDLEKLKKSVLGKTIQEVEIFLNDNENIVKNEISSPFWKKNIPDNLDRIKIKMNI